ncbi:MAG TPA: dTDP-4-dehydrorhamnose 3,5-epimerase family protein [Candidatus Limnocylindrales bacterium]|nr:dTDP-4-dehydrorhamnose 3,5-epimerase family protein [Candidatus Limnocylindrales bacterium]
MTGSRIPGVRVGTVERHADERGAFRELWRDSTVGRIDPADAGAPAGATPRFVQANLSTSASGVLRGLHLHRRQLDRWVIGSGRAFVALVDTRPLLSGEGAPIVETHGLAADDWVQIPSGVAHGFLALEPVDLVYLVTTEYDGSDEHGFAWDDPLAAVPWPLPAPTPDGRPILSARDRANPSLVELMTQLRGAV